MEIELVPALGTQRRLLDIPRGWDRFDAYVASMIGPRDEVLLPLFAFNPMAREHVEKAIDRLVELGAEDAAAEAAGDAARRLAHVDESFRVFLVVADDARGGWTERHMTDFEYRFTKKALMEGWVQAMLWSSESPGLTRIGHEVSASIYRAVYLREHGLPRTLREMITQEGLAAVFAGATEPSLDSEDLAYTREAMAPYMEATGRPTQFACLYGDEAAKGLGYDPLGFSPWAGLALARDLMRSHRPHAVAGTALS